MVQTAGGMLPCGQDLNDTAGGMLRSGQDPRGSRLNDQGLISVVENDFGRTVAPCEANGNCAILAVNNTASGFMPSDKITRQHLYDEMRKHPARYIEEVEQCKGVAGEARDAAYESYLVTCVLAEHAWLAWSTARVR
jgi:hypothetical protein